jgi:hypothetical protein
MERYIEAPNSIIPPGTSIFLAGGISGCPDWQKYVATDLLDKTNLNIYNPRRSDFNVNNKNDSVEQIKWEYKRLHLADVILFWFPKETLCPITLFELGSWLHINKPLVIGCHPDYQRLLDVDVQTNLARPKTKIYNNLGDMIDVIMNTFQ